MGCWNGTCGLSGLPILYGDEIFVFPIVESNKDSFCYSTALYRPSVLAFRAEYNDYGAGEKCCGVGLNILMEGIKEKLIELDVGENRYHDIAVKREGFDVDAFFEACHEQRLYFTNPMKHYDGFSDRQSVYFTMIRKDVVDRLWSEWKFDMWKPREDMSLHHSFKYDKYYVKGVTYQDLSYMIPDYMKHSELECNPHKFTTKEDPDGFWRRHNFFRHHDQEHLLTSSFGHAFGAGYSGGGFSKIAKIDDVILDEYFNGDKTASYELLKECLIGIMVNDFMEHIRKIWTPVMHQGSQSECLDEYILLNKITTDLVNERKSMYDKDY